MPRHPAARTFPLLAILTLVSGMRLSPAQAAHSSLPSPPETPPAFAYPIPPDRGAAALETDLRKLRTRASLTMITAHPDDEDGGLLAYESRFAGADTSLLTLNRGEGGQNGMSANYWDELGLLRTQELLAADQYYGAHQYWTRVADFGFSKTLEETMAAWGHDRVLYDVVRAIRLTRPLVIVSVFAGNVSDGHGQHQVSGEMAQEAYKAAGDPNVFPDQIRDGLLPWSPLKVYARVPFARISTKGIYDYATGHWAPARFRNYVDDTWIEGEPSTTVEIPEGQYDPFYGLSYIQLGRQGLNEQKSQNGGIGLPLPGPASNPYHLYASRTPTPVADAKESSIFDGLDLSLEGIAGYAPSALQAEWRARLAALQTTVERAWTSYRPEDPAKIAPILAEGLNQTNRLLGELQESNLPEDARYNMAHELEIKQRQFNQALIDALGLNLLAEVEPATKPPGAQSFEIAVPGQEFQVVAHLANQGSEPVILRTAQLAASGNAGWKITPLQAVEGPLGAGEARSLLFAVTVGPHPSFTRPYFSRPSVEQPYYDINDPRFLNLPTAPYPLSAELSFQYRDAEIRVTSVVQTSHKVPGTGPVLEPLLTGPPISLWLASTAGIVPLSKPHFRLEVTLHSNVKGDAKGTVRLSLPRGWTSIPAETAFSTSQDGDEETLGFEIHAKNLDAKTYPINVVAEYGGQTFSEGYRMVGYTGLRPYPYYRPATYRATGVDVKVAPGLKIAYVPGTGDDVPRSLMDLGIGVDFLSANDLTTTNLSGYDAIVIGIRAYAVQSGLAAANERLLDYVKHGGVVLAQYQTPEFDHDYGPYPFRLGPDPEKVVDEHAPVRFLNPDDPLFTWPNRITPADFDGWIEERGHDFLSEWDSRYVALTEVHDPDQAPQKGGLLYARYGQGFYLYTAYAFYRQLPEGVPGAFRIFANLLSLKKNPGFRTAPSK